MYANRTHANRPTRITAADRARQRQAIARHEKRQARARARERINRLIVCCAVIVIGLVLFYSATGAPAPGPTYRAVTWNGATVAGGMTLADCMGNYFQRQTVAGCELEN